MFRFDKEEIIDIKKVSKLFEDILAEKAITYNEEYEKDMPKALTLGKIALDNVLEEYEKACNILTQDRLDKIVEEVKEELAKEPSKPALKLDTPSPLAEDGELDYYDVKKDGEGKRRNDIEQVKYVLSQMEVGEYFGWDWNDGGSIECVKYYGKTKDDNMIIDYAHEEIVPIDDIFEENCDAMGFYREDRYGSSVEIRTKESLDEEFAQYAHPMAFNSKCVSPEMAKKYVRGFLRNNPKENWIFEVE